MVFDLLTEQDKINIDSYRYINANAHNNDKCSVDYYLRLWNNAKSEYLEKLFGDKLIVKQPVTFKESIENIADRMSDLIWRDKRNYAFADKIIRRYEDIARDCSFYSEEAEQARFVNVLFDNFCLAENKLRQNFFSSKSTYELPLKDTTLVIQKDMKVLKVISKIANSFGIGTTPDENGVTDLEYFRRTHSLGLNQKTLSGDLCLSIHPLDYMTMSDNNCGWTSCMSWLNDGEYKQGTVEMMNSPCVVVGYLAADNRELDWREWTGSEDKKYTWNSKKWRCLFIVDKDFIVSIKSYPYNNDNLTKAAISELAKMSGWENAEPVEYEHYTKPHDEKLWEYNGHKVAVTFRTGAMYNDFGHNHHHIAINPNLEGDLIDADYRYSGISECIWCGCSDYDCIGEDVGPEYLVCSDCSPHNYCEWCDGNTYGDTYTTDDGYTICQYCWEERTSEDPTTGGIYMTENMIELFLSADREKCDTSCARSIRVYTDNIGINRWNLFFNIDEERRKRSERWYHTTHYVLPGDCTERGLELFDIFDDDDLRIYLGEDIVEDSETN